MFRSMEKWLPGYLRSALQRPHDVAGPRHLIFCVVDHYEPLEVLVRRGGPGAPEEHTGSREQRLQVVRDWVEKYPAATEDFWDADGRPPRHTFFLSPDDYEPGWVGDLARLCSRGHGECELHLHHRNDTADGMRRKLCEFRDCLRSQHGLLGIWRKGGRWKAEGEIAYGFIHGNWALCNSRPDGDWCGVNDELAVLSGTGCYADFTFPSAPSPTQPRMVNAIYRAWDTGQPRAHDKGVRCRVEGGRWRGEGRQGAGGRSPESGDRGQESGDRGQESGDRSQETGGRAPESGVRGPGTRDPGQDGVAAATNQRHQNNFQFPISNLQSPSLLLVQGPLALNWSRCKWGLLPRLDNGGITHHNPPAPERIDLWVRQGIHVRGRPDWVFVKVHAHGCIPSSSRVFLGEAMRRAHAHLQAKYNDGRNWRLHYATAREMYNIVRAAEDGQAGEPGEFRDYEVLPPPAAGG